MLRKQGRRMTEEFGTHYSIEQLSQAIGDLMIKNRELKKQIETNNTLIGFFNELLKIAESEEQE